MLTKLIAMKNAYLSDIRGVTAIEYGLIAGGISLAIVAAVFAFGDDLEAMFNTIGGAMQSASAEVETSR